MLLSLDGTLVVQLVNFVIFLLILNVIFIRPVGRAIAERRAFINGISADIEQFDSDIRSLRTQIAEVLAHARRAADARIGEERAAGQREAEAIVADHQAEANAIIAEAQATVGVEVAEAHHNQEQIVESLARTMLEQAVGPEIVR